MLGTVAEILNTDAIPSRIAILLAFVIPLLKIPKIVGFKVNSERAVQFRKWVNQIAKDYTIKGWVMDDERLKRGTYLTEKYFDEQLERIREIRASERKFYQKITDLYATAIDYDKNSATTRRFYATVQNKMHYAEGIVPR